jgi:hypothetical protein
MQKKSISSAFFNPKALSVFLFCAAACSALTGTLLAFLHPQAPATASHPVAAGLTFEERVSYQRAIEEVYWRHRIWPRERHDPKPALDAVMSQAQLEKKVAEYLRNFQALEDYWQRPITPEQLQAEMDRMAKHTKQPEVLLELFEALGNDPFVIAECLARPALAERLATNWYAYDQRIHGELKRRAIDLKAHPSIEQMKQLGGKYSEIEFVRSDGTHREASHGLEHGITLNSHQWDQTVQKLGSIFGDSTVVAGVAPANVQAVAAGVPPAKGRALAAAPKTLGVAKEASITQIKTGALSSLQEDESRYYTTAILNKTTDCLKLATVSWLKEPFESWRDRAENSAPAVMAAPSTSYKLPAIFRWRLH